MKSTVFNKIALAALCVAGVMPVASCDDDFDGYKEYWGDYTPPQDDTKETAPRFIWIDSSANFPEFADSKENIRRDLQKAKDCGFTDIICEVRATSGDVLFQTSNPNVKPLTSVKAWVNGVHQTVTRTATWDYLQAFVEIGHDLGLKVHAAINTFTGGNGDNGLLFRDPSKKSWATTYSTGSGLINVMDLPGVSTKFFNPANPEVQDFLCDLLKDLAKYDIDGIVLDRGRFDDLKSDFSDISKAGFEEFLGIKGIKLPDDVLDPGAEALPSNYKTYTTRWLEYRAKVIHDFMEKASAAVKEVNPKIAFGVYVGAWYGSYYTVGVNWASPKYDPSKRYAWASKGYKRYGYADHMDMIILGAYSSPTAIAGSTEWTCQGFCSEGYSKIMGDCPLVAGGPDVDWLYSEYGKEVVLNGITQSVELCIDACDGYFLFDMVHLRMDPEKWDAAKAGIDGYLERFETDKAE